MGSPIEQLMTRFLPVWYAIGVAFVVWVNVHTVGSALDFIDAWQPLTGASTVDEVTVALLEGGDGFMWNRHHFHQDNGVFYALALAPLVIDLGELCLWAGALLALTLGPFIPPNASFSRVSPLLVGPIVAFAGAVLLGVHYPPGQTHLIIAAMMGCITLGVSAPWIWRTVFRFPSVRRRFEQSRPIWVMLAAIWAICALSIPACVDGTSLQHDSNKGVITMTSTSILRDEPRWSHREEDLGELEWRVRYLEGQWVWFLYPQSASPNEWEEWSSQFFPFIDQFLLSFSTSFERAPGTPLLAKIDTTAPPHEPSVQALCTFLAQRAGTRCAPVRSRRQRTVPEVMDGREPKDWPE